jgi:ribose transport system permease protein
MPVKTTEASVSGDGSEVGSPPRSGRGVQQIVSVVLGKFGALIALALVIIIFEIESPQYFLTLNNILQILNQSALSAIVACGLTLVLVSGQFDLSIGFQVSLAGIICAVLISGGMSIPLAIIVCALVGALVGIVNGTLVTILRMNALVATLGTGSIVTGVTYLVSGGNPKTIASLSFLHIAIGKWFGIPRLVFYMFVIALILWVVLNKTDFGRNLRAVGGNSEAARLAGVRVSRVTIISFMVAGAAAALTGVALASSVGSGQVTGGDNYTLASFAAAFLGSTVIKEGQFHIVGTLVGVITVAAGFNGLALIGVSSYNQFFFQGVLLVVAVGFSGIGKRLART